jgi:hypothetical protein
MLYIIINLKPYPTQFYTDGGAIWSNIEGVTKHIANVKTIFEIVLACMALIYIILAIKVKISLKQFMNSWILSIAAIIIIGMLDLLLFER